MQREARWRWTIQGLVQGVGFRPFVFRLAKDHGLSGFIANTPLGVEIEVQGSLASLQAFAAALVSQKPRPAVFFSISHDERPLQPLGSGFSIRPSTLEGPSSPFLLPDLAVCPECLAEVSDPAQRRYRYPFTNCTLCGPRYTILQALPYDRSRTSMSSFAMCDACRAEYEDPKDRRFHAQPIACPRCGPHLTLASPQGSNLATHDLALQKAVAALHEGQILALQGLGGFQLLVDARQPHAIQRLRLRKRRMHRPFAVLLSNLASSDELCSVPPQAAALLTSAASPIVLLDLLPSIPSSALSEASLSAIAPGLSWLGILLPTTPLHFLLATDAKVPLVCTSGNPSGEPLCTTISEALQSLGEIADLFLFHDRPILRPLDDSVVQIVHEEPQLLRRARGYAPLPLVVPAWSKECGGLRPPPPPQGVSNPLTPDPFVSSERPSGSANRPKKEDGEPPPESLAVGALLKSVVAFRRGSLIWPSPYIGDLQTSATFDRFTRSIQEMQDLQGFQPLALACDAHPDLLSTRWASEVAERSGLPLLSVPHHRAHVFAGIAELGLSPPLLAFVWDGTGYGEDATIWGGETFLWTEAENPPTSGLSKDAGLSRVASLRPFPLLGGEEAIKHPLRLALALAPERPLPLPPRLLSALRQMASRPHLSPQTSSMGRLFDAVAALLGLCTEVTYEGQAAILLQAAARKADLAGRRSGPRDGPKGLLLYRRRGDDALFRLDWRPFVDAFFADKDADPGRWALWFHRSLVEAMVELAKALGTEAILLTGGCFQNRLLAEEAIVALQAEGFKVAIPRLAAPNDEGIAIGQLFALEPLGRLKACGV